MAIEGEFAFGVGFYCGVDAAALGNELVEAEGESFGFAAPDEQLLQGVEAIGFGDLGLGGELFCAVFKGNGRSANEVAIFIIEAEVHFDPGGEGMGFKGFEGAIDFGG